MDLEKELQDFMDYCEQIDLTWSTEFRLSITDYIKAKESMQIEN